MVKVLDNSIKCFGKNPTFTFDQKYLVINTSKVLGKNNTQIIELNKITHINYVKPFYLGRFILAIPFYIIANEFPETRPFIEITFNKDGDINKQQYNGRFTKNEINEMKRLIFKDKEDFNLVLN